MNYDELLNTLLSNSVYTDLKDREKELFKLIPELKICKDFNQKNDWHIYDVYEHILHVVSLVEANIILRLSALFHDIGKPISYTEDALGIGHFYNHWNESYNIFKKYQENFKISKENIELIGNLILYHDINIEKLSEKELNKIISVIGINNIKLIFKLKRADLLSQNPKYHYLLENSYEQEEKILKLKKYKS